MESQTASERAEGFQRLLPVKSVVVLQNKHAEGVLP